MKNVVITGSTRGLGFEMTKEFLKAGCNVTISGSKPQYFEKAKEELKRFENQLIYIACNVREIEDIKSLWSKSVEKWGKVDIWIKNAVQHCPLEFLWDTPDQYIDAVVDTNIKGIIYGSKVATENMIHQGYGQIWNMEGLGSNSMIIEQTILYGTSKCALTYFSKALAKFFIPRILKNTKQGAHLVWLTNIKSIKKLWNSHFIKNR